MCFLRAPQRRIFVGLPTLSGIALATSPNIDEPRARADLTLASAGGAFALRAIIGFQVRLCFRPSRSRIA